MYAVHIDVFIAADNAMYDVMGISHSVMRNQNANFYGYISFGAATSLTSNRINYVRFANESDNSANLDKGTFLCYGIRN